MKYIVLLLVLSVASFSQVIGGTATPKGSASARSSTPSPTQGGGNQSPHSVLVQWSAPGSGGAVTLYMVFRGTVNGGPWNDQICQVGAGTFSCVDHDLVIATTYFYIVVAFSNQLQGPISSQVSVAVP